MGKIKLFPVPVRAGDAGTPQFPFRLLSEAKNEMFYKRFEERFTSVAAVQPSVVRRRVAFLERA